MPIYKNENNKLVDYSDKPIIDTSLSDTSENAVQNKVVKEQIDALTTQINNAIALRSSLEQYGMAKLSNSAAVTDSTGLALPATEKNATIEGTLANQIAQLNTDSLRFNDFFVTGNGTREIYMPSEVQDKNIAAVSNSYYPAAIQYYPVSFNAADKKILFNDNVIEGKIIPVRIVYN